MREDVALLPSLQAPLLGLAWVLFNVALGWLGQATGCLNVCSVLAGAVDGTIFSVIVVATASEKFQAGATGLLGGLGLDNFANGGQALVTKAARAIHGVVDAMLASLPGGDNPVLEAAHEAAVLRAVWIAIIVVLAALIAKWVQSKVVRVSNSPA